MKSKKTAVKMVAIPESELESLKATIETLENKYVMEHLAKSDQDIKHGRVRPARAFLKELQ